MTKLLQQGLRYHLPLYYSALLNEFLGATKQWDIPFDSELDEVTISITGENRNVKLYDPDGREYTRFEIMSKNFRIKNNNRANVFINNNETYVAVIKNPQPVGRWRIETRPGSFCFSIFLF